MMGRVTLGVVLLTSTLSLLLLVASANTCRFVLVSAVQGAFVEVIDTSATTGEELTQTFFDAFCNGHLVGLGGDIIWILCKIFHSCAMALGAAAAFLGTMVNVVPVRTRPLCWQTQSICSALCALVSVPVFLLFEAEPCKEFPEQQSCSFAVASYLHVAAIVFAVITTVYTQCFEPPTQDFRKNKDQHGSSPTNKIKPGTGGRWFPLESEHEDVDEEAADTRYCHHVDLVKKGAVVTNGTEEDDDEEEEEEEVQDDRARSDVGVIGITESQDEVVRLLPLNLSYEFRDGPAGALEQDTCDDSSDIALAEDESVDLSGPAVVYEALEREAPIPRSLFEPSLAPTDEGAKPLGMDLAQMPSLIDNAEDDETEDPAAEDPAAQDPAVDDSGSNLGSLEPTVISINGAESVLDRIDSLSERKPDELSKDTPTTTTQDEVSGETKPEMAPKRKSSLQLDIARLMGPRRRNGYRLMDDTDLDASLPMSPPLEIVTMNMINTSLEYDDFEDLYDNGNRGPDAQTHRSGTQETMLRIEVPQDDDEMDPELLWNDDDDFVGIVSSLKNKSYEVCDADNPDQVVSPLAARPSCLPKRRRGNRKWNASLSLVSANSLLSYTIAEETASDLIETDDDGDDTQNAFDPYGKANLDPIPLTKSRSAPNLARFDRPIKKDGWVVEDLQITGVNAYKKKAQVFPTAESSSVVSARRSTGGMKDQDAVQGGQPAIRPSSSSSLPGLLRSEGKKLSTFREEKVFREGIHATTSTISDASGIDSDLKSLPSPQTIKAQDARDARIRRLQNSTSPIRVRPDPPISIKPSSTATPTTTIATLSLKSSRPPRPPPLPAVVSPLSSPISKVMPPQFDSPESLERSYGDESDDTIYGPYALNMLDLNLLDATLAELNRDDFDPDERSV